MFKIGQEIVCITHLWKNPSTGEIIDGPKKNEVCVLEGFHPEDSNYLLLKGHNQRGPNYRRGYNKNCFRPVVKPHKGMEVLREILINPKVKIKEDA